MAYVLTNKTAQTPLGFGALGFTLEPGQSRAVTPEEFKQVDAHPVMAGWIAEGAVYVERKEPPDPDVKVEPPKVPTPTAKK